MKSTTLTFGNENDNDSRVVLVDDPEAPGWEEFLAATADGEAEDDNLLRRLARAWRIVVRRESPDSNWH